MLDNYLDSIENSKPNINIDEGVDLHLESSPIFNPNLIDETIQKIDTMSNDEIYNFLRKVYKDFLDTVFNKTEYKYINLFTNERFLSIFNQAISSIPNLTKNERIYCNKIAYDYMTLPKVDKNIKSLLIALSKIVNRDIIPSLIGLGLDEYLASYAALSRYSTFKDMVNTTRLNLILINGSKEVMTEQRIICIYEKLFDNVTPLFEGIIFDSYNDDDGYTEEMEEISSIISLAILDILESMESNDIRLILTTFYNDYTALYSDRELRFSMQSLGPDYPRINKIVDYLNEKQDIYLP